MRIALPAVIDPGAFSDVQAAAEVMALDGVTMGTRWSLRFARPPLLDAARVRRVVEAVLDGVVAEMSHWDQRSLLSRWNGLAAGESMVLPAGFAQVIGRALAVATQTGGAYDPTLGRLAALHGYGAVAPPGPATEAVVAAALAEAGWRRLGWNAATRRLTQPGGVWLDLSGSAKGYAADAAAAALWALGVRHCLVEVGGELVGRGVKPDGDPWWVELEAPPGAGLEPLRVALHGLAAATSGDGRRGAHTLDPRTGWPVTNGVATVSVLAATALDAELWATALTVLGPEEGVRLAAREGVAARLIWRADGGYYETLTPALAAMLD